MKLSDVFRPCVWLTGLFLTPEKCVHDIISSYALWCFFLLLLKVIKSVAMTFPELFYILVLRLQCVIEINKVPSVLQVPNHNSLL